MKTYTKHILAALLVAATIHTASGQSLEPFNPYGIFSPEVETFSMVKYGDIRPSLYTGAMSFSVPLYTYQDPDFTIPITLEYNFDGYKPAQHSGSVGYGWYLNCGGAITREVRGIPDEGEHRNLKDYYGWLEATSEIRRGNGRDIAGNLSVLNIRSMYGPLSDNISQQEYAGYISSYDIFSDIPAYAVYNQNSLFWRRYEMSPDIYRFHFPGCSGEFTFDYDGNPVVYNTSIPEGEISVSNPRKNVFVITVGNGTEYTFREADISHSINLYADIYRPEDLVTGYRLVEIKAPNGRTVTFDYASAVYNSVNPAYGAERWGTLSGSGSWQGDNFYNDISSSSEIKWSFVSNDASKLTGITIDGIDVVDFAYEHASRNEYSIDNYQDSRNTNLIGQYISGMTTRLSSITVRNRNGQTVESCVLEHEQPSVGTPKLLLKSVSTQKGGKHSFSYHIDRPLPPNDTQDFDHWGYWNGNKGIHDLRNYLVNYSYFTAGMGYYSSGLYDQLTDDTIKASDAGYSKSCALARITYPTGGTTDIAYEGNTVSRRIMLNGQQQDFEGCDPYEVGGVRVRSITNTSAAGESSTKTFHYSGTRGGTTSGILTQMPRYAEVTVYRHEVTSGIQSTWNLDAMVHTVGFSICSPSSLSRDSHINYPEVTEEYPDGSYTVYSLTSPEDYPDGISFGWLYGRCPFTFHDQITLMAGTPSIMNMLSTDRHDLRGKPQTVEKYDTEGNVMSCKSFTYRDTSQTIVGGSIYYPMACQSVVKFILESDTETSHGISVKKEMTYNSYGQVSSEKVISGGEERTTYYRYRHETDSTATLPALISAAVKTTTVDSIKYITGSEAYSYAGNNPQPAAITEYVTDAPARAAADVFAEPAGAVERTTEFTYDNKQRLTRIDYPGGEYISYTWDPDGILITSKTQHGTGNRFLYEWKDLVGLTRSTSPSGMSESYTYDNKNRLQTIKDTGGNTVTVYEYSLYNE